jgi:hypothetical protein
VTRAPQVAFCTAVLAAALVVAVPAGGANECEGLQVCVPVVGPWVPVSSGTGTQRRKVEFELRCPRNHIVGGLDARLSVRAIDVHFLGMLGSPVNPGITTSRSVTFVASHVGAGSGRAASFKPFIGCMPSAGGGTRIPTSVAAFPPGRPTTRRVKTVRVRPGSATVAQSCVRGERLVGASHAFGFYTPSPPSASLVSSVSGTRSVRGTRVVVRVRGDAELEGVRAVVQVHAVCAGAR